MVRLTSKRILQGLASREAQSPVLQVLPRQYHTKVVEYFDRSHENACSFDSGDVLKLQIKVDESTGQIVDACFKTFG